MEICRGTKDLAYKLFLEEGAEVRLQELRELSPKYNTHRQPKPGGGFRIIAKPIAELLEVQRFILNHILSSPLRDVCPYVHGGIRERSYRTNAWAHRRAVAALSIDLKGAFTQGTRERVREALKPFVYSDEMLECILDFTVDPELGLPQGAATSTALFNLICGELDETLSILAVKQGMRYTRYVDDLTFSSRHEIPLQTRWHIAGLIKKLGWQINPRKVRYYEQKHGAINVTGLSVHDEKVTLTKKRIEELRILFHRALTDTSITLEHLDGKMSQVRQVYGKKIPRRLAKGFEQARLACLQRRPQKKGAAHAEAPDEQRIEWTGTSTHF